MTSLPVSTNQNPSQYQHGRQTNLLHQSQPAYASKRGKCLYANYRGKITQIGILYYYCTVVHERKVIDWRVEVHCRCFHWFPAAMLVSLWGTPIWRFHTELYNKFRLWRRAAGLMRGTRVQLEFPWMYELLFAHFWIKSMKNEALSFSFKKNNPEWLIVTVNYIAKICLVSSIRISCLSWIELSYLSCNRYRE